MPENARKRAVVLAVKLPNVEEDEFSASLVELTRLVNTLGYDVVARVTQARDGLSPAAVLGEGKLMDLAKLCGGSGQTRFKPKLTRSRTEPDAQLGA